MELNKRDAEQFVGLDEPPVLSIAFSPERDTLAVGSWNGVIRFRNVATGEEIFSLDVHAGAVCSIAFSPDGKWLASGHENSTVLIWDVAALLKDKR
jgi:WD40 repeat protein